MNENIVVVTEENAQSVLIEESLSRPVLIDFWADWCGPCKNLMPVLEKLAQEYAGEFLLAKVDADAQNMIAAQFGVRSLPTVILMKDGQPVDGFTGAQSEPQVREFLDKHLPSLWQKQVGEAQALIADGKYSEAIPLLKPAYEESGQAAEAAFPLVEALIATKDYDAAEALLSQVKMVDQDATFEQLSAQLELARQAKRAPEIESLEGQLKQDPENKELALQLAVQLSQHEFHQDALERLYPVLQKDLQYKDGEARKIFTDILALLGKGHPVAVTYQRKLYTLLY